MKKIDLEKQSIEVITKLQTELGTLDQQSNDAVQSFKDTLSKLEDINTVIDSKVEVVQNHIEQFQFLKDQLIVKKASNLKISSKIKEFLGE